MNIWKVKSIHRDFLKAEWEEISHLESPHKQGSDFVTTWEGGMSSLEEKRFVCDHITPLNPSCTWRNSRKSTHLYLTHYLQAFQTKSSSDARHREPWGHNAAFNGLSKSQVVRWWLSMPGPFLPGFLVLPGLSEGCHLVAPPVWGWPSSHFLPQNDKEEFRIGRLGWSVSFIPHIYVHDAAPALWPLK